MNNQPPKKRFLNANSIVVVAIVLLIATLGCCGVLGGLNAWQNSVSHGDPANRRSSEPASNGQIAGKSSQAVTWADFDRIFGVKSSSTTEQKDALWKEYEGKPIEWTGVVVEFSDGSLNDPVLSIRMNPDTTLFDVQVNLKKDQVGKLDALRKGDTVTFTGTLQNYGGKLLPTFIENGEIK